MVFLYDVSLDFSGLRLIEINIASISINIHQYPSIYEQKNFCHTCMRVNGLVVGCGHFGYKNGPPHRPQFKGRVRPRGGLMALFGLWNDLGTCYSTSMFLMRCGRELQPNLVILGTILHFSVPCPSPPWWLRVGQLSQQMGLCQPFRQHRWDWSGG